MSHVQYKQLSKTIDIEHFSHFALWKLTTIYLKLCPLVKYFRVCSHCHHFWWYWLIFQYSLDILFWIWTKWPDQKKENFCFHTHTHIFFYSDSFSFCSTRMLPIFTENNRILDKKMWEKCVLGKDRWFELGNYFIFTFFLLTKFIYCCILIYSVLLVGSLTVNKLP